MKITKSQLQQIIKEELSNILEADGHQMTVEKVKEVVELWNETYNNLPDDSSKERFERWLNQNLELYTKTWQKERGGSEYPEEEELPGLDEVFGKVFGKSKKNPADQFEAAVIKFMNLVTKTNHMYRKDQTTREMTADIYRALKKLGYDENRP